MNNGFVLRKAMVNLLCCFIPQKKWRKRLRYDLADRERRRRELFELGFKIEGEIIITPQGVRIDISDKADHPLYLIKEVFVKNEYKLNITKESVLIDIGMNRAAASLFFATNENIKKIYSYEPFKPTFELAQKNLDLNPQFSKKISAFNLGVGKEDTTLELPYQINATGGMSTTYDVCKNQKNTQNEIVTIKDAAKLLCAILEENKGKHLIVKCDCEGAEFEIFRRLNEKGLMSKIDVVMMEYHFEKPDELVDIFTENSFAVQTKIGSRKSKTGYIYAVRMAEK